MNTPNYSNAAKESAATPSRTASEEERLSMAEVARAIKRDWSRLVLGPVLVGGATLAVTLLMSPVFTAKTSFLPPQQQQSSSASALASLGALSGIAGAAGAIKTPGDQYVGLLQSFNVADAIIDKFKLMEVYDVKYRAQARKLLIGNTRISLGKKDGIISVEVDDHDPKRAAAIANQHVEELRRLTGSLALTEAQQRRVFFEGQLSRTKNQLITAQQALESSGFNPTAIKAEPKSAAEAYGKLKAEATSAEVRLQTLLKARADGAAEVVQQRALVSALRDQLAKLEASTQPDKSLDYITRYREYKYQETLFDLFARQYESARVDESKEGALLQVIDIATAPELKSRPRRLLISAVAAAISLVLLLVVAILRKKT